MNPLLTDDSFYIKYDLSHFFRDALYNQLHITPELLDYLQSNYQITPNSHFLVLGVWLGKNYEEDYMRVRSGLIDFHIEGFAIQREILCLPSEKFVLCILYPMIDRRKYQYFQHKALNDWSLFAPEHSIFLGERCIGFQSLTTVLDTFASQLDWNLVTGNRILINSDKIKYLPMTPLQYPTELDGAVEKALLQKDIQQFTACFQKLTHLCQQEIHTPDTIKSICIRYAIVVAHIARINDDEHTEIDLHHMIRGILDAVYWMEIWDVIYTFSLNMLTNDASDKTQNLLIVEAQKLMISYYCQGITLEEIAEKLHVTEEYLSTIFKKETGRTFSQTIRKLRIKRVKELLKTSRLKINDIAQLAGYSDGKYMSRVFKEDVGMSPNEYRKARAD